MSRQVCPVCALPIIHASGFEDSPILIVGSSPTDEEQHYMKSFCGVSSRPFKRELFKTTGIDINACRVMLAWFHEKPTGKKKSDCIRACYDYVQSQISGRKLVILVGADAVTMLTGLSINDVNGFDVTEHIIEPKENVRYFALVNYTSMFRSIGEMRFGLKKLKVWKDKYFTTQKEQGE